MRKAIEKHIKQSPVKSTKTAKTLKFTALAGVFVSLILIGLLFFYVRQTRNTSTSNSQANQDAADLISPKAKQFLPQTLTSSLGFSAVYDINAFDVSAQVTDPASTAEYVKGTTYEKDELKEVREYSIFKFRLKEADTSGRKAFQTPDMTILTNIRKDYWANRVNKPEHKNKSKLQIFIDETVRSRVKTSPEMKASKPENVTINGFNYKKVIFTRTNTAFGLTTRTQDDYYFTVQNDRPYYAAIYQIKDETRQAATLFETIINTISFEQPDTTKLSKDNNLKNSPFSLAEGQSDLPSSSANVPATLDAATVIRVAAKNQPAVVRIATAYCADIDLLLSNGVSGLKLKNACTAMIGSGSFVSEDGYVATNGHVVRISAKDAISGYINLSSTDEQYFSRVEQIASYLADNGVLSRSELGAFMKALRSGQPAAIAKVGSLTTFISDKAIRVRSDDYTYALQTSNEPIRADFTSPKIGFKFTETVIKASYVDSNFDSRLLSLSAAVADTLPANISDVAILKAEGKFPIVKLGAIDNLQRGDRLTAIGFPGFTDGGLSTQRTTTVPSITQGLINSIGSLTQKSTNKLLVTTVPIAQGNSGGPAFDDDGQQVGLNTYSYILCPDKKCFGEGIARDVADYKALISKNSISLDTTSEIATTWENGLTKYVEGDFRAAVKLFEKASEEYPANYLAKDLLTLTKTKAAAQGSVLSSANPKVRAIGKLLIGIVIVALLAGISLIIYLVRGSKRHHAMLAKQTTAQPVPQPVMSTPVMPQQPNPVVAPQIVNTPAGPVQPQTNNPVRPPGSNEPI